MIQQLWIAGAMPNLNDIIHASGSVGKQGGRAVSRGCYTAGARWNAYNDVKRKWSHEIMVFARQRRLRPLNEKCFTFLFVERNMRRDPDNFIGGGMKIIFDALQECRLLAGDGWKQVQDIKTYWTVEKDDPGVFLVASSEVVCPLWADAFSMYQKYKTETNA
jgi:hypothetical protein